MLRGIGSEPPPNKASGIRRRGPAEDPCAGKGNFVALPRTACMRFGVHRPMHWLTHIAPFPRVSRCPVLWNGSITTGFDSCMPALHGFITEDPVTVGWLTSKRAAPQRGFFLLCCDWLLVLLPGHPPFGSSPPRHRSDVDVSALFLIPVLE